jgi:hypothetical protein
MTLGLSIPLKYPIILKLFKNAGAEHDKRNNVERLFKGEAYRLTGFGIPGYIFLWFPVKLWQYHLFPSYNSSDDFYPLP